jgi:hypothetical protein
MEGLDVLYAKHINDKTGCIKRALKKQFREAFERGSTHFVITIPEAELEATLYLLQHTPRVTVCPHQNEHVVTYHHPHSHWWQWSWKRL